MRIKSTVLGILVAAAFSGAAVAADLTAQATPANGCQAGQVLQANGDPCNPAVAPPPPTTVQIFGPTAAQMSRALAVVPAAQSAPVCAAGQVLQGNTEPCTRRR